MSTMYKEIIKFRSYEHLKSIKEPYILLVESKLDREHRYDYFARIRFVEPSDPENTISYQRFIEYFQSELACESLYKTSCFVESFINFSYDECVDNMRIYDLSRQLVIKDIILV